MGASVVEAPWTVAVRRVANARSTEAATNAVTIERLDMQTPVKATCGNGCMVREKSIFTRVTAAGPRRASYLIMTKYMLGLLALLFLAPLVPTANAQVVVKVGHAPRHCWYSHHHRHCR